MTLGYLCKRIAATSIRLQRLSTVEALVAVPGVQCLEIGFGLQFKLIRADFFVISVAEYITENTF